MENQALKDYDKLFQWIVNSWTSEGRRFGYEKVRKQLFKIKYAKVSG